MSRLSKALRIEDRWLLLLACLLATHLLWGALRIPGKVYGKRLDRIRRYQEVGGLHYHFDDDHRQGPDLLQLLLASTPPECILLWRGKVQGSIEFVPPMIAPRLLVAESACPTNATQLFGRPLARGQLADGRRGIFVLVSHEDGLDLELR